VPVLGNSGNTPYVLSYLGLILNIIYERYLHASFKGFLEYHKSNLFNSKTSYEYLNCLHCFATKNNTSKNIFMHAIVCLCANVIDSLKWNLYMQKAYTFQYSKLHLKI
jgi:hypothetical protein